MYSSYPSISLCSLVLPGAPLVQQPHTLANIIVFMAKSRGGGGENSREQATLLGDEYLNEAFHATSYVADLQEQITKLIALERRRKNAALRLQRNRATHAEKSQSTADTGEEEEEEQALSRLNHKQKSHHHQVSRRVYPLNLY